MDQETSFSQIFDSSNADKSQPQDLSGSQLPDFTPSSTANPISRPAVQDTAVGRVLPFSQVAPGLYSPIPMGNTAAPSGTGAAATGAASGAATGAAAARAQVLESVAQAQARKRLERMWSSSKSSSLAFRARVRGSKTALPYNNLILWVVSLLRVGDLAYTYAEWHKTSITSLPVFVSVLRKNYPHLHTTIIKALELRGEPCRNAVEDACDTLFGHFSGQLHSAFIYGVVLYCLLDSESPRQDELRQMLHRYLYKQASELPAFEDSCRHPEAATLTSAELQAEYSEAQLVALPGYRRLSPVRC